MRCELLEEPERLTFYMRIKKPEPPLFVNSSLAPVARTQTPIEEAPISSFVTARRRSHLRPPIRPPTHTGPVLYIIQIYFQSSINIVLLNSSSPPWVKTNSSHQKQSPTESKQKDSKSFDGTVKCVKNNAEMKTDSNAIA
ncbi:hypothetical protein LXL04_022828 [Taraxacum kok-saghyz]